MSTAACVAVGVGHGLRTRFMRLAVHCLNLGQFSGWLGSRNLLKFD